MNKGTIVGVMIEPMKGEKVRQEEINSKTYCNYKRKGTLPSRFLRGNAEIQCIAVSEWRVQSS